MNDPRLTPDLARRIIDWLDPMKGSPEWVAPFRALTAIASGTHEVVEKGRLAELREVSDSWRRVAYRLEQEKLDLHTALTTARADLEAARRDGASFQSRVQPWMTACFGAEISRDITERNHRFIEEALELVQALGCTQSEAHQLVDYVFGRSVGEPLQEAGGVMVTLAALCLAADMNMHEAGETELRRIWGKIDVIRAKQAAKPKHSPLPHADALASRQKGG